MSKMLTSKWKLSFKILPYILVIVILKLLTHKYGLEFLTLSPLFTALVSANIFLIGFLISGVLVDYKESEKIPGELAVSLEVIADECEIIYKNKKSNDAKDCLESIRNLNTSILDWFYKKEKTINLMNHIKGFNDYFLAFEPLTQANFIVRMKNEQSNLRKLMTRAHAIREISFNKSAYTISEVITFVLSLGFVFAKIEPYREALFFVIFVPFILIYMIFLIKDLDNPFDYYSQNKNTDEVSLKPLLDLQNRLK